MSRLPTGSPPQESLAGFLAELERLQVTLAAEGGELRASAPTGVLTPELVGRLRVAKEPLLAVLADRAGIPRRPAGATAVASFAQEDIWLRSVFRPGDSAVNLPLRVDLAGPLRPAALRRAFSQVLARHEVLRTTFSAARGRPVPVTQPSAEAVIPLVDLGPLPEPAAARALTELATQAARRPFDLARGPVLRALLVRRGPGRHTLLITRHHIASDGWSLGILLSELSELYSAQVEGRPHRLPGLPVQYGDFAAWQREQAAGPAADERLERWVERLRDAPPGLDLLAEPPRGGSRDPVQRRGAALAAPVVDDLRAAARTLHTTLFTVLLTAFGCALERLAGQQDIVIGTPAAGRSRVQLEPLIGPFVTVLPLRLDMSGEPTVRDLIRRHHAVVRDALGDQELPAERLVERLRPQRSLSDNPLFAVSFALQNTPAAAVTLPELTISVPASPAVMPKYAVELTASERDGELDLVLEYDAGRLPPDSADRLYELILAALEAVLAPADVPLVTLAPGRAPGSADVGSADVRGAGGSLGGPARLHDLVASVAASQPDAIAVSHDGTQLSYRALLARARELAAALRSRGAGPESLIGLSVAPSAELVIAAVAIVSAGAAYLPLDTAASPSARARLCAAAGVSIVVTDSPLLVDGVEQLPARQPRDPGTKAPPAAGPPVTAANMACVLEAPASSPPAGAIVTHASLAGLLAAARHALPVLGDRQSWSLASPPASAAAAFEMWGALTSGGRLAVTGALPASDPQELWARVVAEQVTVLSQPAGALGLLAPAAARTTSAPAVSMVLLASDSGEARLAGWPGDEGQGAEGQGDDGPARPDFVQLYGQPESSGYVLARTLTDHDAAAAPSPLGALLPGQVAAVLGPRRQPMPAGRRGELHVGGAGLARGYLGRPALTADRFVPYAGERGARVAGSGALARVGADGDLTYLGPVGGAVERSGLRIEPGEIEAALLTHPDVLAAAVVPRSSGERRYLAGFVVARSAGTATDERQLREHAAGRLPRSMVPARLIFLDALPVTSKGEVDRAALAGRGGPDRDGPGPARPPTPTELTLTAIVAELLSTDAASIGPQDNLFDLGGGSLTVTQLHSRIIETFNIDPPVRRVYQSLDIASLAAAVDQLVDQRRLAAIQAALAEVGAQGREGA